MSSNNKHPVDLPLTVIASQELQDLIIDKVKDLSERHKYRPTHIKWYRGQWLVELGYLTGTICDEAGGHWSNKRKEAVWCAVRQLTDNQRLIFVESSCYDWLGLYDPGDLPQPEPIAQISDPKDLC